MDARTSVSEAAPFFGDLGTYKVSALSSDSWKKPSNSQKKPSGFRKKLSGLQRSCATNAYRKSVPNLSLKMFESIQVRVNI